MDKIHGLPRTKDFTKWEAPRTSIEDIAHQMGANLSEDELLLVVLVQEDDLNAMRAAGPIKTEYSGESKPLGAFIKELMKRKKSTYISIKKENFSLTLRKIGRP
jgi:oxaloacetate decarboxylase alpha subunit